MDRSERALIQVQATHAGASAIAAIFLSLYLFKEAGLQYVPLFFVADYVFQSLFFVLSGFFLRRSTSRQLIRVGLALSGLTYLLLAILGHHAPHYVFLLGALMGVADGFYWASINVTEWAHTHENRRNKYLSVLFSSNAALQVVGPLLASLLLFVGGYRAVFILLTLFWFVAAVLAGRLPSLTGSKYRIGNLRELQLPRWKSVLSQNFLRGLWFEPLGSVVAVLLLFVVHTAARVTFVTVVTTLAVSAVSLVVGRILQARARTYWIGALIVPIGLVVFAVNRGWLGLVFWALAIMVADLFANTSSIKSMYDVMDGTQRPWQEAFHLIVQREAILNTGRVIGYGALYVSLTNSDYLHVLKLALLVAAVLPVLSGVLQWRINRRQLTT